MSDAIIACRNCGESFAWSHASQAYYKDHGLSAPTHCPDCRARRRAAQGGLAGGRTFAERAATYPRPRPRRPQPTVRWQLALWWLAPWLAATALLAAMVAWLLRLDPCLAWLIAVNTIALSLFAYDKGAALGERQRVPEVVLLSLTVLGGVVGAFMAMWALRHKTSKGSFQIKFWLLASVPVVLILVLVLLRP